MLKSPDNFIKELTKYDGTLPSAMARVNKIIDLTAIDGLTMHGIIESIPEEFFKELSKELGEGLSSGNVDFYELIDSVKDDDYHKLANKFDDSTISSVFDSIYDMRMEGMEYKNYSTIRDLFSLHPENTGLDHDAAMYYFNKYNELLKLYDVDGGEVLAPTVENASVWLVDLFYKATEITSIYVLSDNDSFEDHFEISCFCDELRDRLDDMLEIRKMAVNAELSDTGGISFKVEDNMDSNIEVSFDETTTLKAGKFYSVVVPEKIAGYDFDIVTMNYPCDSEIIGDTIYIKPTVDTVVDCDEWVFSIDLRRKK